MRLDSPLTAFTVAQLKCGPFLALETGQSVRQAVERMRDEHFDTAVVTNAGQPMGILTPERIRDRVLGHEPNWDRPVEEFCEAEPALIHNQDSLQAAFEGLRNRSHLCLVDGQGQLIGLVSRPTLLRFISQQFAASAFSTPPGAAGASRTPQAARK